MNTSIVGRHLELTQPLKDHVDSAIHQLKKYNLDIISVKTFLFSKEHNKEFGVEITISVAGQNTVIVKQKQKDLYSAIDTAIERCKKKLRRMHDKMVDHRNDKISIVDFQDTEDTFQEDEIVPMDLKLHKPMEIEDALSTLNANPEQNFLVFNDLDYKLRIMYKRKDGRFGLY
jgi:putative sigma-54 modulation protein